MGVNDERIMSSRHAYLIMAHKNIRQLNMLLAAIDDRRNDVFLHLDRRCVEEVPIRVMEHSRLRLIPRRRVLWGHSSQIDVEIDLIAAALSSGNYEYLHLLTGQDLPIKTQDDIHDFFNENRGWEFISFAEKSEADSDRVRYWWPVAVRGSSPNSARNFALRVWGRLVVAVQRAIGVNRCIGTDVRKGSVYFSITESLAKDVVAHASNLRKRYAHTRCADEVFLQTFVWNSRWRERLYHCPPEVRAASSSYGDEPICDSLRLIDWRRGSPYVWQINDLPEIMNARPSYLFARKFDMEKDSAIIREIIHQVSGGAFESKVEDCPRALVFPCPSIPSADGE